MYFILMLYVEKIHEASDCSFFFFYVVGETNPQNPVFDAFSFWCSVITKLNSVSDLYALFNLFLRFQELVVSGNPLSSLFQYEGNNQDFQFSKVSKSSIGR